MNDAAIELPANFKDNTMHVFTTGEPGSDSFTLVVSRSPMERGDTVDTFATRLVSEMRKTLPRFKLNGLHAREVDGEAAREIDYEWVSDGTLLHQRQTVVISPMRGEIPIAIGFIGTCPKGFTSQRASEYDDMVASTVLKRRQSEPAFVPEALPASASGVVFVLNERTSTLYSLSGLTELFRHDVTEMFDGIAFYGAAGEPLSLNPAPHGEPGWRAPDGRDFLLWTVEPQSRPDLAERLVVDVKNVYGAASLSTIDHVRAYLSSVANAH
ncbi:MAG: DcrB-related protein [Pseudomonadota bacterium]